MGNESLIHRQCEQLHAEGENEVWQVKQEPEPEWQTITEDYNIFTFSIKRQDGLRDAVIKLLRKVLCLTLRWRMQFKPYTVN